MSTSFWGLLLFLSGQSVRVKGTATSLTHPRGTPAQLVTVDSPGQKRVRVVNAEGKEPADVKAMGAGGGALGLIPGQ